MRWPLLPWDFALILLALGIVVPWRGAARMQKLLNRSPLTSRERLSVYASTIVWQWLATGLVAWRSVARGVSATRLALVVPDRISTAIVAVGLTLLLAATQAAAMRRLARTPPDRRRRMYRILATVAPQNPVETLVFVALVITVALCEEFLYRGFVFAAIQEMAYGSLTVAALGSSALFAFAHLYQGPRGIASTFLIGSAFVLTRIYTGSLAPPIVAHFFTDLAAGAAAQRLLKTSPLSAGAESTVTAQPGVSEGRR